MMLAAEGPSALPLWINGHAFLTMTEHFHTVTNPANGQALRLLPLCGARELELAIQAADAASRGWRNSTGADRQAVLRNAAEMLEKFTPHFSKLLREETGMDDTAAQEQVQSAQQALLQPETPADTTPADSLCFVLMDASQPLAAPAARIATCLLKGQCVLVKTSVKAPAAVFALAELLSRAGLPAGVVNLLHGDDALLAAIAESSVEGKIHFSGHPGMADKIRTLLSARGKALHVQE